MMLGGEKANGLYYFSASVLCCVCVFFHCCHDIVSCLRCSPIPCNALVEDAASLVNFIGLFVAIDFDACG